MLRILISLLGFFLFAAATKAQVQTDCDFDAVSDLTSITTSGAELAWSCIGSSSAADDLNTTFGLSTDAPAPAKWLDADSTSLATIRQSGQALVWRLLEDESSIRQKKFGKAGDNVLAGADFNGDGIADAAVVRFDSSGIRWQVKPNLFSAPRSTLSFTLGTSGDRVFYFNPNGQRDCAAAFGSRDGGRPRLTFRDLKTRKVRTFSRFSASLVAEPRVRPFPVQNPDGADDIAFALEDESDTTIRVMTFRGRKVDRHHFPGQGTIVVGDFDPDSDGEEIVLQTSSALFIYNPSTGEVSSGTVAGGTLIDEINIGVVGTGEASPTPTPEEGEEAAAS